MCSVHWVRREVRKAEWTMLFLQRRQLNQGQNRSEAHERHRLVCAASQSTGLRGSSLLHLSDVALQDSSPLQAPHVQILRGDASQTRDQRCLPVQPEHTGYAPPPPPPLTSTMLVNAGSCFLHLSPRHGWVTDTQEADPSRTYPSLRRNTGVMGAAQ